MSDQANPDPESEFHVVEGKPIVLFVGKDERGLSYRIRLQTIHIRPDKVRVNNANTGKELFVVRLDEKGYLSFEFDSPISLEPRAYNCFNVRMRP